jgi:hypothetical protein
MRKINRQEINSEIPAFFLKTKDKGECIEFKNQRFSNCIYFDSNIKKDDCLLIRRDILYRVIINLLFCETRAKRSVEIYRGKEFDPPLTDRYREPSNTVTRAHRVDPNPIGSRSKTFG